MKETKEFKTETKKLLDMMIHSIYTHKEIFLRELISNASDAIDKRHFMSLTDSKMPIVDYEIKVEADKANRTLTISDNGIGMTKEELEDNLGTIAKSGSKEFLEQLDKKDTDVDIIGQFGVGFYSAFMVASKVEVLSHKVGSDKTYLFTSEGLDSYTIEEVDELIDGTKITLYLRENQEDENYDTYLDEYTIKDLIRKYSDYVRYPIKTWVTKYDKPKDGKEDEESTHLELETINSMIPLWKKNKSEVKEEELNEFYKQKFMDYQDPLLSVFVNVEGLITYRSLLFIPRKPLFNMYNDKNERGLQLYTKGVFILDKCKDLIPEYLYFVKGLVDSADLPLNISRELLQEDRQIKKIATNVEKRLLQELERMLKNEPEKYQEFFKDYGRALKFGLYENYGARKESLQDLIILHSLTLDKMVTFKEYKENMKEDQKAIYYASNLDGTNVKDLPQVEVLKQKGYDILVLSDDVDEFMLQVMKDYDKVPFKSISEADLNLLNEEESKAIDDLKETNKDFLKTLSDDLKDDVSEVTLSKRLVDDAFCLTTKEGLSLSMEKVLKQQDSMAKASKVLELNPKHGLYNKLENLYKDNKLDELKEYISFIYDQALIVEGLDPKDPIKYSKMVTKLLLK